MAAVSMVIKMRFHLRRSEPSSILEVIELIERFIDDQSKSEYEWADFIDWDHSDPEIESIRKEIEQLTPILLSRREGSIERYKAKLAELLARLKADGR